MILVVDDDHTIVQLVKDLLDKEGFEVCTAYNGEKAYELIKDPSCKGVLLDMLMPGINGAEILMLMASESVKVPVIVMCASPDFEEDELKQFPNVRKVLHKPFYPEDLVESVRQHFAAKR